MNNRELSKFKPGEFFHIYNRGNNGERILLRDDNFAFFLTKFDYYLSDFLEVYAYCVMTNHFHLLVRIKLLEDLVAVLEKSELTEKLSKSQKVVLEKNGIKEMPFFEKMAFLDALISEQFRRLFVSYSKAINNQQERTGSLFEKPFKRKIVNNQRYLTNLVSYIHNNPVIHKFVDNPGDWQFSSYNRMVQGRRTKLRKKEVLSWFGGQVLYEEYHDNLDEFQKIEDLIIES